MIKAGIVDVGGVLHDSSTPYIFADIKTTLKIDENALQSAWSKPIQLLTIGSITEKEFWNIFTKRVKVTKPLPRESLLLRAFIKYYGRHDDVLYIVRNLKRQGLKMAVLSNTIQPHAKYQHKIGIYQQFDVAVLSNEVGIAKPAPEAYQLTLEKLKVKPAEAFFVDDAGENVEAAVKLGIHGILYQNSIQLIKALHRLGIEI